MRHARPRRFAASRGFTLIESILVVVLLGLAAATIISMQRNIFFSQDGNRDLEVGVQLMQECAEQILAIRRQSGYPVDAGACSTLGNTGGFGAPSVNMADDSSGAACPSGGTCSQVVISVSKPGASLTPVTLELVSY
jgi:prepilin-type N-terminal cleavage/methylation domain-containing protein